MELFVENKQGVLFNFFSLLFNVVRRKCAFKASEGCFSVYYANTLIIVYYAFKTSGGILFSLFSYFCNSETWLFKSSVAAFVIPKMYVQNKWDAAFYFINY